MKIAKIRFLEKGEKAVLPKGLNILPQGWQRAYIEKRNPFWLERDKEGLTAVLQTEKGDAMTAVWRKNERKLLERLKKQGVEVVIPPVEGEFLREVLPLADGRRLTNLFAFSGEAEALKRQGKHPGECRYLLAGGSEGAWRSALTSMGNEVNHLAIFTADVREAKKLEQELFEEHGLMAEVFASPKHPAFGEADVVFGCGMEQRKYEYLLKNGAVWIDLAGNRPVLRKLQDARPDVFVADGFFFRRGKRQAEEQFAEAEAFLSCVVFRENWQFPLAEAARKEMLCELKENGYAVSGFSVLGKRVKIKKNQGFQRENVDNPLLFDI